MIEKLYSHRFEIFFGTQLIILFGSLFFPNEFFEDVLTPLLFLLNTLAGILLVSKKKKLMWFLIALFGISLFVFGTDMVKRDTEFEDNFLIRLSVYFIFYVLVTYQIVLQIWKAKNVSNTVVIGLMSGYLCLGFIAFFLFTTIELLDPGSYVELLAEGENTIIRLDSIMYYAYITLMTIGYGEIVPTTPLAQKAAILVGLVGQFYLVIITAVVVGKFINQSSAASN